MYPKYIIGKKLQVIVAVPASRPFAQVRPVKVQGVVGLLPAWQLT